MSRFALATRTRLIGDRFGAALRISAFSGKMHEAAGLLSVRLQLLTECDRALPTSLSGPHDPDGPPFG